MAIFKCKMCGGTLEINNNETVAVCEYCGTKQTVPVADDEKKLGLYARANKLRIMCEFDKAAGIYESIVTEFPEESEAYWGLCLCNYGIEYVDDPVTSKKVPTCHRSSFDSIFDSNDFEMVMENADLNARSIYREEAKVIEDIRKSIIEVSSKEEPYDIFICYKETDEKGDRTIDSVIAQDVYNALIEKGYRVFFSRITLEDKLGQEYEPYIFAALNSAKVMLAFGTNYEYFNAVWVKNEWSRFLNFIEKGEKKTLIPCYKNIDAYDMPKEFAKLQAQDMGKVGAIQDLVRGVEKIIQKNKPISTRDNIINNSSSATVDSLLKRAYMFLEDGDWTSADEYYEKVLDINPECAEAYLGKLMVDLKVSKQSDLKNCEESFDANSFYQKIIRFADAKLTNELKEDISYINERNEIARKDSIYEKAISIYQKSKTAYRYKKRELYQEAYTMLDSIGDWKDSTQISEEIKALDEALRIEDEENDAEWKRLETKRKQKIKLATIIGTTIIIVGITIIIIVNSITNNNKYNNAIDLMDANNTEEAVLAFRELGDYKDSVGKCLELQLVDATVGDKIIFGSYEQDYSIAGVEPIEWRILDIQEDKLLLISENSIEWQPYNKTDFEVTWRDCTLREYLNSSFFKTAFSKKERDKILMTANENGANDRVFLLDREEAELYFKSKEDRVALPSKYVNSLIDYNSYEDSSWWLRCTTSYDDNLGLFTSYDAAQVEDGGNNYGSGISKYEGAVRPVIWIEK